jgi:hypothetical protein
VQGLGEIINYFLVSLPAGRQVRVIFFEMIEKLLDFLLEIRQDKI